LKMRRAGECGVDGDRRRGWRFGAGGRRPEELQHEDDGGRRIVEDHDGRWSGTELPHEDKGATPAKRSGKEWGTDEQGSRLNSSNRGARYSFPFFSFGKSKAGRSSFRPSLGWHCGRLDFAAH
jgi:hypothetical protein